MTRFLALALLICSCGSTDNQKAESSVRKYVQENFDDPSSYELVSLEIDTAKAPILDVRENEFLERRFALNSFLVDHPEKRDSIMQLLQQQNDSSYLIIPDSTFGFWMGIHKYRAKNMVGAKVLSTDTVYFDRHFRITNYRHR